MVGGRDRLMAQGARTAVAAGMLTVALRVPSACCTGVAAVAGDVRPIAVSTAKKAVMRTVHSLMTLLVAMIPHFRVGRFAYFPHDVYVGSVVGDRRPWRVDVQMNTTRMDVIAP